MLYENPLNNKTSCKIKWKNKEFLCQLIKWKFVFVIGKDDEH